MDVFTQCQYRNVFLDRIFFLQQQRQTWSPSACQKMLRAFLSGVFRVMRCARNPTVKFSGKLVKTVDSDALSPPISKLSTWRQMKLRDRRPCQLLCARESANTLNYPRQTIGYQTQNHECIVFIGNPMVLHVIGSGVITSFTWSHSAVTD